LPEWHILYQQASTRIGEATGKNHANGKHTGRHCERA
jgi:hypothetical protein